MAAFNSVRRVTILGVLLLFWGGAALPAQNRDRVCAIVTGLGGMPEYEENFLSWGENLEKIFQEQLGGQVTRLDGRRQTRDEVLAELRKATASVPAEGEFWLFLIGHANHDGTRYRFNIRGPDLTSEDLGVLLDTLGSTRTFIVAATSASGALVPALSGTHRVIVTATRNASERQPPLFLSFFLEAASSVEADIDKNGQVSLLEAYLFSRQKVAGFFEEKKRIQTEHPLLDDRGEVVLGQDKDQGNPSFEKPMLSSLASLSAPSPQAYRTQEARQLAAQKTRLEREIEDLKFRKAEMPEAEFYRRLEQLVVQLAELNEKIAQLEAG